MKKKISRLAISDKNYNHQEKESKVGIAANIPVLQVYWTHNTFKDHTNNLPQT